MPPRTQDIFKEEIFCYIIRNLKRERERKKIPVVCFRSEDAKSSDWLRRGRVSKIHLAVSDLIQGWAPLTARLYVCWTDPEPCLGFSIIHRELTPAFNYIHRRRVNVGWYHCISWETARNKCERSACWSSSLAEAKFKSHNKIVCHWEAINGGGLNTDAGRVTATPPTEVKTRDSPYFLEKKSWLVSLHEYSWSENDQRRHTGFKNWTAYPWANFSIFFRSMGCTTALEMVLNCTISQSGWWYV